jgi:hypothetical protein
MPNDDLFRLWRISPETVQEFRGKSETLVIIVKKLCLPFFSGMGGVMSREETGPPAHHSHFPGHHANHEKDYPQEILDLRNEIRRKSVISLERRYVFLLYYPPGYPVEATADYMSSRLNLPIQFSSEEGNSTADYYLRELLSNDSYKNGWIICDYPATVPDIGSLKRLLDSENGSLNILYFDLDGEVCPPSSFPTFTHSFSKTFQSALRKFDRYVHPPSNRSYHLVETPPKSLLHGAALLDDITGENLVKVITPHHLTS